MRQNSGSIYRSPWSSAHRLVLLVLRGFFRSNRTLRFPVALLIPVVVSCIPVGPAHERVQGTVLDAETNEPFASATVRVRILCCDGFELGSAETSVSDGHFAADVSVPAESPRSDQVEIIVVLEECEQPFVLESDEDIVVDVRFTVIVLEVREPILVPPCPE